MHPWSTKDEQENWVATANDERCIPEPILNRMNVFEVHAPDPVAARAIALRLYKSLRGEHDWAPASTKRPQKPCSNAWPRWRRARCAAPG
jgi:hypothetical protein